MDNEERLQRLLGRVQKPARYLGNEWNAIKKEHAAVAVRMALAFPDLYEVGMSNLGLKILYEIVNRRPEMLLERVFAPAVDMEELMRESGVHLFALESHKPVREFDLVGFSLQYELIYSNVLNMLDLADIPLYSEQRGENDPLIIGGGPCAFNPEPLAPFFDLILLGDGEEALLELLERWIDLRRQGSGRREILSALASLTGVYVPSLYRPSYNGAFRGINPVSPAAPPAVKKRVVSDLDRAPYPASPIVPYIQVVHDRAAIELFRGCGRGCRFCQAGVIYRPVRRRSLETLKGIARETLHATGYEEISLASLSSSDHPAIDTLIDDLSGTVPGGRVKISLPSLRMDSFSVKLAARVHQGRRGSLTFAPEAGTERLRRVIGKDITETDIFEAVGAAVETGWQAFKLYFMIGLPTETDHDVEGIARLCRRLLEHIKQKHRKWPRLSVSAATFIPKPHTPFQWEPQLHRDQVKSRQRLLKASLQKIRGVRLSWHDSDAGFLEAVFARGDRLLAPLLERAWRKGCRFDGWSEQFHFDRWLKSFHEMGLDPDQYAYRRFTYTDPLPWDHLLSGVSKDALIREHRRSAEDNLLPGGNDDPYSL